MPRGVHMRDPDKREARRQAWAGNDIWTDRKHSEEARKKMSDKARKGADSNFWKGGATEANKIARQSSEYRLWREAVFARNDYTCQFCGQRGGRLNPDHIKKFADYPELRFDIDNGRTLCEPCHKETDTYGNKGKRKEQLHDIAT